ncbi:ankyrin repeat-containing protein [Drechmeria coniospora]|uniref:Ankyrin repeat-containing protein n=1 Tax=Drechmeria coniospora TaxID=98403 RepID=A0A151GQL6_DRECN|nr:ankyrin repeat-containing protein [Drechmeria coniospora]KYK59351.1 ankyrin repeat-containing protein [Drechmeria coniospora]
MTAEQIIDGTIDAPPAPSSAAFSWLKPHPIFVIILVGPEETPFGIQKDFLCHRSTFYRRYFADGGADESVEHVVRLPDFTGEVFGLAQHYLYTGRLLADDKTVPSYEALVGLWNLGHKLAVEGLCDKTLELMKECRRLTERIPAPPLLVQVWRDTPQGSAIRLLLLSWAAEYMRLSDARAEFAKSLPQEVLSELVVAMSAFDMSPAPDADSPSDGGAGVGARKNVHYLDDEADEGAASKPKKSRRPSGVQGMPASSQDPSTGRRPARTPLPKLTKRRSSAAVVVGRTFTAAQKLEFCADLLNRMLSGPGA